ncbi:MAG: transposase [Denitromonas halophila]|nr:MAG: transposase [Denitromonas halophila]
MERFNRSVRHDWLIHSLSESIPQSRRLQRDGSGSCNHERPNMGLRGITPKHKLALAA